MLYALVSETLVGLIEKLESWKSVMESKGLRVYLKKTKVMISGSEVGKNRDEGRYPCAVCRKRVSNNSICCKFCKLCVHERCSGIKGRLKTDQEFKCKSCAQGGV